jgi:hypothetical protein
MRSPVTDLSVPVECQLLKRVVTASAVTAFATKVDATVGVCFAVPGKMKVTKS